MEPRTYNRTCRTCNRQFVAIHGAQRLCSATCRRERGRFHLVRCLANLTPGSARKTCVVCHAAFLAGKTEVRPRQSKTCSSACQHALNAQQAARQWLAIKACRTRTCVECGTAFRVIDRPRKRTCSERCQKSRRQDSHWRTRQRRIASGKYAADEARRRASGYMKRYKRQWRRRRAEEHAQLELIMLTAAIGTSSPKSKGGRNGKCD